MATLREWIRRVWGSLRRQRADADLEAELQLHKELAAEDVHRRGGSWEDAGRLTSAEAGGTSQAMDALRDQRGLPWLDDLGRDIVYSCRSLLRARAFAATAVLTLALGIGANTAIFSLIDAVVLRPLPVANPSQLIVLTNPAIGGGAGGLRLGERDHVTYREFETLRTQMTSFSGMFAAAAWTATYTARLDGQPPEDVKGKLVSGDYFTVLGVPALTGRTFSARDENGAGSAPFAVLSYAYWQRRFGGSPAALKARLRIGDTDFAIIGVAPTSFLGESVGEAPDVWIPAVMQPQVMPGSDWIRRGNIMWLHAIGRLVPGATLERAQSEANVVFAQMLRELSARVNPRIAKDVLQQHLTLRDASRGVSTLRGNYAVPLYILMGLVALVLTISCTSVATLLLARAGTRRKEFDIRLAVGAGRFRLFRQLLTESLVLSAIAGLVGALFAVVGVRLLVATVLGGDEPGQGATLAELGVRPDVRVLLFTISVCLTTVLAFGLAPAWSAVRINPWLRVRTPPKRPIRQTARTKLGHALVVWQVALSVVLLIGAGWFLRSLRNLETFELGYPRQIAQITVEFPASGDDRARLPMAFRAVQERLAAMPGVRAATYSQTGLLGDNYIPIRIEGFQAANASDTLVKIVEVGPDYFSSIGIPIVRGRGIDSRDGPATRLVCVINQSFASFFFPKIDPIGRFVIQGNTQFEIVGVAQDARDTMTYPLSFAANLRNSAARTFYPAATQPDQGRAFQTAVYQVRMYDDPSSVLAAAPLVIQSVNPGASVKNARTLDVLVKTLTRQERSVAQLAAVVGGVALLLACIGLYGLLTHVVTQRTNEIGIRIALGAQRPEVIAMVLKQTAILVAAGLAVGIPASLAGARLVQSQLFGLTAADVPTLLGAMMVTCGVATVAGYLPARRAARINPLTAIRTE